MGCHRRLGYARLLNRSGFGFVTVFVPAYVSRFLHYSARSLKKGFSVCFHSVQPLPNSHNKSVCFLVPQHFTHLFSHLLHAVIVYSVTLHFLNRISNPHLPLGITPHGALSQPSFNQPQVFSTQSNANKNMCQTLVHTAEVAGCPVPVHFLLSPSLNSQSARSVPVVPPFTCFTASGNLQLFTMLPCSTRQRSRLFLPFLINFKLNSMIMLEFLYYYSQHKNDNFLQCTKFFLPVIQKVTSNFIMFTCLFRSIYLKWNDWSDK